VRVSFYGFMVVVFAVLGGLAAYHLEGGRRGGPRVWRGVAIGAVVGLLLPALFGVVAALIHLVFYVAIIAIVVLGVMALVRFLR
jgi:hypothetical protein